MGNSIESLSNPGTIEDSADGWTKIHHENVKRHTVQKTSRERTAEEQEEDVLSAFLEQQRLVALALNINYVGSGNVARKLNESMDQLRADVARFQELERLQANKPVYEES